MKSFFQNIIVAAFLILASNYSAKADQAFPIAQMVCTPEQGYFSVVSRTIWDVDPSFSYRSNRLNQMSLPINKSVTCRLAGNDIQIINRVRRNDCAESNIDLEISVNGKVADTLVGADCSNRKYEVAISTAAFPPPTSRPGVAKTERPDRLFIEHCRADMVRKPPYPQPSSIMIEEGNFRCETSVFRGDGR